MRPREPFTLYSRKNKKGEKIWYWRKTTDRGRSSGKSTGCTSKTRAREHVVDILSQPDPSDKDPTFGSFAANWWIWDRCLYVRGKQARGKRISEGYVATRRSYLEQHIMPTFRSRRVSTITPAEIEDWVMRLRQKKGRYGKLLSAMTINQVLGTLKIMLAEGVRRGDLSQNPAATIEPLGENRPEKGILTTAEVRALFNRDKLAVVWDGDLRHYVLNLLSAHTGMRLGECQALARECVCDAYIDVQRSFARKYGFKEPKLGSFRKIPLQGSPMSALRELMAMSPYQDPGDLVFWGPDRYVPIDHKTVAEKLYAALGKIKITSQIRKARRITFHSWRHFANSYLRAHGVPDVKLRRVTGHKSEQLSDHYTHFHVSDLADVVAVQESILEGGDDEQEES